MKSARLTAAIMLAGGVFAASALQTHAAPCGGDFRQFLNAIKKEAVAQGVPRAVADRALANARIDQKVLRRDRAQGFFKQTFLEFSRKVISGHRMQHGKNKLSQYASTFQRAEREYGVPDR